MWFMRCSKKNIFLYKQMDVCEKDQLKMLKAKYML